MTLRPEVVLPRPPARRCIAAMIVLMVAAIAAFGADRRATDMERRRATAEADAEAAHARLHLVEQRFDRLVVPAIPDVFDSVHPSERDLERARQKLAELQLELRKRQAALRRMPRHHGDQIPW